MRLECSLWSLVLNFRFVIWRWYLADAQLNWSRNRRTHLFVSCVQDPQELNMRVFSTISWSSPWRRVGVPKIWFRQIKCPVCKYVHSQAISFSGWSLSGLRFGQFSFCWHHLMSWGHHQNFYHCVELLFAHPPHTSLLSPQLLLLPTIIVKREKIQLFEICKQGFCWWKVAVICVGLEPIFWLFFRAQSLTVF